MKREKPFYMTFSTNFMCQMFFRHVNYVLLDKFVTRDIYPRDFDLVKGPEVNALSKRFFGFSSWSGGKWYPQEI